ncbi:hypothetical protein [uncultured Metabacillus sp.]|uniref:hypothetical protein n=1 Tax=uncultured Metabacillus sp. TaxID=2860135 RepID=UPI002637D846|nr:hypothetical protein [uncultured Metabacillus sp.]
MELKKVVGSNVTHIAEARYKNFNGVNLNTSEVIAKAAKKRTPEEIKREMIKGYMALLSK